MASLESVLEGHELFEECENLLRKGRADLVSRQLSSVSINQLNRSARLPFARLCRRAGLFNLGLKTLAPLVRPQQVSSGLSANDEEKCEYAYLIMKSGSPTEALQLLRPLQNSAQSEAKLYVGYCHMMRWQYKEAAIYLNAHIREMKPSYEKIVAQVNLASALIASEQWGAGTELLAQILGDSETKNLKRLQGNCLELRSQIHLHLKNYSLCMEDLEEASQLLANEKSMDQLFVLKWKAILKGLIENTVEPIFEFQKEALKRRHWESVRECDLFALKIQFDSSRFEKLYCGTPFSSYKERIERELGVVSQSSDYLWGPRGADQLDLLEGVLWQPTGRSIPMTPQVQKLLCSFCSDLYKPFSVVNLFSLLMADEYFDPVTSPNRVHQMIWRARAWLEENEVALSISEHQGSFRLELTGQVCVRIPQDVSPLNTEAHYLNILRRRFHENRFSSRDALAALKISKTSFFSFVKGAVEERRMICLGQGRATLYRIL